MILRMVIIIIRRHIIIIIVYNRVPFSMYTRGTVCRINTRTIIIRSYTSGFNFDIRFIISEEVLGSEGDLSNGEADEERGPGHGASTSAAMSRAIQHFIQRAIFIRERL
jgi:hypothetical protein